MNEKILQQLGFEKLLVDYWRKGNLGVLRRWDKDKAYFIVAGVNEYPPIESLHQLKEIYKKETKMDDL